MSKVIGITDCGEKYPNYERWIMTVNDVKVIRLGYKFSNLDEVEKCDGILLTGGEDVHPRFYGSDKIGYPNHPKKFAEERDEFEIQVFKKAEKKNVPILGVCRGLQLINCVLDGTLKQDLGQGNDIHRRILKDDKIHCIKIESDTLLSSITNVETEKVNSSHHQAINKLGQGLTINAKAEDGTIEGIERNENGKSFLLAVQWHPERMEDQQSPLSKNIRDRFIEEIRKK